MTLARIKKVLEVYHSGGINALNEYFEDSELEVKPSTWVSMIKHHMEKKLYHTVKEEIEFMKNRFYTTL